MPKPCTFPDLVEDCLILSISDLRKWGYLIKGSFKSGTVKVTRNGHERASYSISVNTLKDQPELTFNYTIAERHSTEKRSIEYSVELVQVPSNLGKGFRYYFVCPSTGKRASKLYKAPGSDYFLHREAYPYLMYDSQIQSKKYRFWNNTSIGIEFKLDHLTEEFYSQKRVQKYYNGKPTKKYQKILDLERLYKRAPGAPFYLNR